MDIHTRPQTSPLPAELKLYGLMSRMPFRKSYVAKIMLVAFVGTHVPLLTLFAYALLTAQIEWAQKLIILAVALVATLLGTAATLLALNYLLKPIMVTARSLRHYLHTGEMPQLPRNFNDEAGILMADTMYTVNRLADSMHQLRYYDGVTSLPNRLSFSEHLQQRLRDDAGQSFTVLLIDLDGFTAFNGQYGHQQGDRLLRDCTQRLHARLGRDDLLARVGEDEFALLLHEADLADGATLVQQTFAEPFVIAGEQVVARACAGLAVAPFDGRQANDLLAHAGFALREAKQAGNGEIRYFSNESNRRLLRTLELGQDLYKALERQELQVHYQPKYDAGTARWSGVEALLRWHHPRHGMVSPAEFIPIAETSQLIERIGAWTLRQACQQLRQWRQDEALAHLSVSVNLSARQFHHQNLLNEVRAALEEAGIPPSGLVLELTESLLMEDVDNTLDTLRDLCELGVKISLDDFGTGYSSMSYLKRFPLHELKIDRSFVTGLDQDRNNQAIVGSIIRLAQGLGLEIVAEGVETPEESRYLQDNGCRLLQGFHYARPLPAEDARAVLGRTVTEAGAG